VRRPPRRCLPAVASVAAALAGAGATACSLLDWRGLEGGAAVGLDAGGDAAGGADGGRDVGGAEAGDAAPRCDLRKPFDAPVLVPGPIDQANENEVDGFFTPDELTLYFARDHGDGATYDIYVATRRTIADAFGSATVVSELSSAQADRAPFLLRDGRTMYFSSDREGHERIYVAVRPDPASPFGAAAAVPAFDVVSKDVGAPFFLGDDVTLYFSDDYDTRPMTARAQAGSFTAPVAVAGLVVPSFAPKVTADDMIAYYTAAGVAGESDIFVAVRPRAGAPFAGTQRVAELSTDARDEVTWVSADGCHVLLASARANSMDLYFASRP
jgi:WD40-like Beta Propeller Repeat